MITGEASQAEDKYHIMSLTLKSKKEYKSKCMYSENKKWTQDMESKTYGCQRKRKGEG